MHIYRTLGLCILLLASPVFGDIVEREILFDNELGTESPAAPGAIKARLLVAAGV